MRALTIAILGVLATSRPVDAKVPPALFNIMRSTVPADPDADVATILTTAPWRYANPLKERSTWESAWLEFSADHQVVITTNGPSERKLTRTWAIVSVKGQPVIRIDEARYKLGPCMNGDVRTVCLFGPAPL